MKRHIRQEALTLKIDTEVNSLEGVIGEVRRVLQNVGKALAENPTANGIRVVFEVELLRGFDLTDTGRAALETPGPTDAKDLPF